MHVYMQTIKNVQARVDISKYNKLKKVAEARQMSINDLVEAAIEEYTAKYLSIDPNDPLFKATKFDFKETDLSSRHAKYRFER